MQMVPLAGSRREVTEVSSSLGPRVAARPAAWRACMHAHMALGTGRASLTQGGVRTAHGVISVPGSGSSYLLQAGIMFYLRIPVLPAALAGARGRPARLVRSCTTRRHDGVLDGTAVADATAIQPSSTCRSQPE